MGERGGDSECAGAVVTCHFTGQSADSTACLFAGFYVAQDGAKTILEKEKEKKKASTDLSVTLV